MQESNKIVLLVGAPGSGKSTYGKTLLSTIPNSVLISSDQIRFELTGDESNQTINGQVFKKVENDVKLNCVLGKNVIVDATNINRRDRKIYIEIAQKYGFMIEAYVFECDKQTLINRNAARGKSGGRNVPEFVIDKMLAKYQSPSINEGFDHVFFIK